MSESVESVKVSVNTSSGVPSIPVQEIDPAGVVHEKISPCAGLTSRSTAKRMSRQRFFMGTFMLPARISEPLDDQRALLWQSFCRSLNILNSTELTAVASIGNLKCGKEADLWV